MIFESSHIGAIKRLNSNKFQNLGLIFAKIHSKMLINLSYQKVYLLIALFLSATHANAYKMQFISILTISKFS